METMNGKAKRTFFSYLMISVKGFCMGAADVVPGVSGGTMAFILGIYEELISAIRSFDIDFINFSLVTGESASDVMVFFPWTYSRFHLCRKQIYRALEYKCRHLHIIRDSPLIYSCRNCSHVYP